MNRPEPASAYQLREPVGVAAVSLVTLNLQSGGRLSAFQKHHGQRPSAANSQCSQGATEPTSWPIRPRRGRQGSSAAAIAPGSVGTVVSKTVSPSLLATTQMAVFVEEVSTNKPSERGTIAGRSHVVETAVVSVVVRIGAG